MKHNRFAHPSKVISSTAGRLRASDILLSREVQPFHTHPKEKNAGNHRRKSTFTTWCRVPP